MKVEGWRVSACIDAGHYCLSYRAPPFALQGGIITGAYLATHRGLQYAIFNGQRIVNGFGCDL